ncbi:MAG: DUF488 domain-containing protein [Syntrophales bacterium LBB04]|nr:DUF488 domain-containing protein [Syntrophales bacterium LBB04]
MKTRVQIKRVYDAPTPDDGRRILVDRLWPRGLTKEKAKIEYWAKGISPSSELRKWYGHEPGKWEGFKKRYFAELGENKVAVEELLEQMGKGPVTFVYSSTERTINNAEALKIYLEAKAAAKK